MQHILFLYANWSFFLGPHSDHAQNAKFKLILVILIPLKDENSHTHNKH